MERALKKKIARLAQRNRPAIHDCLVMRRPFFFNVPSFAYLYIRNCPARFLAASPFVKILIRSDFYRASVYVRLYVFH